MSVATRVPRRHRPRPIHWARDPNCSSASSTGKGGQGGAALFRTALNALVHTESWSALPLMSSRLAPAIWSSFRGTRLEGLFGSGHLIGGRHAPPRWSSGCVRLLRAELRPVLPASGGRRRRGGGTMEIRDGGLTAQCSMSARGVGGGSAGGDQQLSSSSSPSSSSVLPSSPPASSAGTGAAIRFCSKCGGATEEKIPAGETVLRFVCCACGAVHYQNPKMVVGCLVEHEEKVLLCRRNCEPAYGLWTLPAGYLEIGESSAEGAARETLEEACADVQILGLFSLLDIPVIGQCVTVFRARLKNLHFAPGPESLECALFKLDEIPFEDLAFGSIHLTLKMYLEDIRAGQFKVHQAVIDKRPGASRSDLKAYVVRDVLTS